MIILVGSSIASCLCRLLAFAWLTRSSLGFCLLPSQGQQHAHRTEGVRRPHSELLMSRSNRGLETTREGAKPTEGGMALYLKAAEDGTSPGDCPFAHFVRMVLEEKGLEYDMFPTTADTKPGWLIDHYEGKMPALRHRKECYVESNVIADYLDFFFPEPELSPGNKAVADAAEDAIAGFFPAVATYLKHTPDGDEEDGELRSNLESVLRSINDHLETVVSDDTDGPRFLTGSSFTLLDCSLAPKLYHMQTGLMSFKGDAIAMGSFPYLQKYMDDVFSRESFQQTTYDKEIVTWGWSNARGA